MTRTCALALVVATLGLPATARAQSESDGRPTLSIPRVGGELVAGAYGGFLGFYGGRFVGERLSDLLRLDDEAGVRDGTVLTFAYMGAAFGTAGAVYGVGSMGSQTGDFSTALLGTGAGFVVAVAINKLLFPHASRDGNSSHATRRIADAVEILLPAIGSTIAFNSTRRFSR